MTAKGKRYKNYWLSEKVVEVCTPDKEEKELQNDFGFTTVRKFEWPD